MQPAASAHPVSREQKKRLFGTKAKVKRFPTTVQVGKHQGEQKMKAAKTTDPKPADLVTKYRPLGLKAVLAAALQAKVKPIDPKLAKRPNRQPVPKN